MTKPAGAIRTEAERNLALLGYGLLGLSIFFAGTTALVGVLIAYWLHDAATPELSRHFRAQVRIFWVTVILLAICVVMATAGLLLMIKGTLHHDLSELPTQPRGWFGILVTRLSIAIEAPEPNGLATPRVLMLVSVVAGLGAFLWSILASAIGFIRLASSKHIGQTAHP